MKRKLCVVSGSRADYGLLYWLLKEIRTDPALLLQLAVTGMHLSGEFGDTYREIEKDGFQIDAKVETLTEDNSAYGVTQSLARGVSGFAAAFRDLKPDVVVVLGDRYEIFAAAQAAMVARIPIAHIHGGESTEGAIDEAIRHSITKMAHLHFTASAVYARRVVRMGEDPTHVFVVGAPGLDHVAKLEHLPISRLQEEIGFRMRKPTFLVTYHPVTLSAEGSEKKMNSLFEALDSFEEAGVIFTKSNADMDGVLHNRLVDAYVKRRRGAAAFTSLGRVKYLSAMRWSDVVIGNSSSGVIEAPALKKPSVNIGDRQKGRLMAPSVLQAKDSPEEIVKAVRKALSEAFQRKARRGVSPYGQGGSVSRKIKEMLKRADLENILMKQFHRS